MCGTMSKTCSGDLRIKFEPRRARELCPNERLSNSSRAFGGAFCPIPIWSRIAKPRPRRGSRSDRSPGAAAIALGWGQTGIDRQERVLRCQLAWRGQFSVQQRDHHRDAFVNRTQVHDLLLLMHSIVSTDGPDTFTAEDEGVHDEPGRALSDGESAAGGMRFP
jgi:hypothetical protein